MSDANDDRIEQCRRIIAECRAKAENLDPEEKQAVQTVIESYEELIALMQGVELLRADQANPLPDRPESAHRPSRAQDQCQDASAMISRTLMLTLLCMGRPS